MLVIASMDVYLSHYEYTNNLKLDENLWYVQIITQVKQKCIIFENFIVDVIWPLLVGIYYQMVDSLIQVWTWLYQFFDELIRQK